MPAGGVDVLTFTSAPAVAGLLARAMHDGLVDALRPRMTALCVGPVTAAPLPERDVATGLPQRSRPALEPGVGSDGHCFSGGRR